LTLGITARWICVGYICKVRIQVSMVLDTAQSLRCPLIAVPKTNTLQEFLRHWRFSF